ncbi:Glycogen phosphorylase, brain form [Echinococcus granulosus]|uniref:Alpha-1,4 glucan phosphorylase n=1 Tax=Echinococcus granulosus TaxID=6210 RepID=W6UKB8_ECHGR|nr:Glycogen phosphorylase, brain form [Echinococcus granulosus]EUB58557.1 Glycogen phosphorylase, brain form [Echinococcus granulosus]
MLTKWPGDMDRLRRMSIIEEDGEKRVNMAYLCIIGSHAVNGVSEVHSKILKDDVFHDFYEMWPEKFQNKTNGITPRRWLLLCNPSLSDAIMDALGDDSWITNFEKLKDLTALSNNIQFLQNLMRIKRENKAKFASYVEQHYKIKIDPSTLFDFQVKRIHEYKRQLLNCFYVIAQYNRIKANPNLRMVPRTVMIGGKAAPGYHMAKLIIKLINSVGKVVNNDPIVRGRLKNWFTFISSHASRYDSQAYIDACPELKLILSQIGQGYFSPEEPDLFKDIYKTMMFGDRFMLCADFADYMRAQADVDKAYRNEKQWAQMMLANIAGSWKFSSDRTIREYARDIWGVEPREEKLPAPFENPEDPAATSSK